MPQRAPPRTTSCDRTSCPPPRACPPWAPDAPRVRETGRGLRPSQESVMVPRADERVRSRRATGAPPGGNAVELMSGKGRKAGWALVAALAVVAGCSGDIAGELGRNVQ